MAKLTREEVEQMLQSSEDEVAEWLAVSEEEAVVLGKFIKGDQALAIENGRVLWSLDLLEQHMLIIGKIRQGKTTTALLIAYEIAKKMPNAQIFFIDGNADFAFGRRFCGAMLSTGRTVGVFPLQRLNGWPTGEHAREAIFDRALAMIRFAEEGGAKYYSDAEAEALRLGIDLEDELPSSTKDLLGRLDFARLADNYDPSELQGLRREEVQAARMRVSSVYRRIGTAFDGPLALGDRQAWYLALDPLVFKKLTGTVLEMLLAELAFYVKYVKDPDAPCVVMIDEYASLGGSAELAIFVEQARKLGVYVIVLSQLLAGLGDEVEKKRIMYDVGTVITHKTHEYQELLALIGTKRDPELTLRYQEETGMEPDRLRQLEVPKVKQGELAALRRGEGFLFIDDKAMKLKVEKPDESAFESFELPKPEELHESAERREREADTEKEPLKVPPFLAKDDLGGSAFKGERFHVRHEADEAPEGDPPAADEEEPSP